MNLHAILIASQYYYPRVGSRRKPTRRNRFPLWETREDRRPVPHLEFAAYLPWYVPNLHLSWSIPGISAARLCSRVIARECACMCVHKWTFDWNSRNRARLSCNCCRNCKWEKRTSKFASFEMRSIAFWFHVYLLGREFKISTVRIIDSYRHSQQLELIIINISCNRFFLCTQYI